MNKGIKDIKVAIVSDHCFAFAGASSVTKILGSMFDNLDYYFLMGNPTDAKGYFSSQKVYFSFLNRLPFVRKYYRYTYFLWPVFIESFDFSRYDLVLSSSFSVSHGVITGIDTYHIAYIHTPMRYAWDLEKEYFSRKTFFLKRWIVSFFLNFLRIWDTSASSRPDCIVSNSNFVKDRIYKYWRRTTNYILNPPVELYEGNIKKQRGDYFVAGAPFEANKGGEFLLECAVKLGFNLRLIGVGDDFKKLKRRYSKFKKISFLGRVSQKEKYDILAHAKGFLCAGTEDFGIFPVEAMSCGTPVISLKRGGYIDSVVEGVNGVFFEKQSFKSFKKAYERFLAKEWKRDETRNSVLKFSKQNFIKNMKSVLEKELPQL